MSRAVNLRKILLFLGDICLLYFSLLGTIFFGFWGEFNWNLFYSHLLPFSLLYLFWLIVFYIFGLYDLNLIRSKFNFYPRIAGSLFTNLILGMIFFYLIPLFGITPKTNLLINIVIFGILIILWRNFFYFLFSSHLLTRVAIFAKNSRGEELAKEIKNRPYLGYKLVDLNHNQDLFSQIQGKKIDTLIVAENLHSNSKILKNLYELLPARINFLNFSKAYELICQKIPIDSIDLTWFLENLKEGEKTLYNKVKRGLDLILASLILILTSPLLPFIALAIKFGSGGPIIYKQERIGKDKKSFLLYKFRSMKIGAEKGKAIWAKKEDPRITKVGKFLRQTHLDELPQMINVLKGNISLVGPRPERPEFVKRLEKEIPHYHLRHLIKPGFTGWAQIKFRYGRSIMDSHEKFQYDLYYLKNRSLILDLGILLKTFQLFFKKE